MFLFIVYTNVFVLFSFHTPQNDMIFLNGHFLYFYIKWIYIIKHKCGTSCIPNNKYGSKKNNKNAIK